MQEVTIREYFSLMRKNQKDVKPTTKYNYAKAYIIKRLDINKDGAGVIKVFQEYGKKWGVSPDVAAATLALRELNLRIEEDMMEFAAEYGLYTFNAIKADRAAELADNKQWNDFGYISRPHKAKEVHLLREIMDLDIVTSQDRPLYIADISNPFLVDKDENPFVSDEEYINTLPWDKNSDVVETKDGPVIMTLPDWDKLSEEDWQKMRETAEGVRLKNQLKRMVKSSNEEEKKLSKQYSLIDESNYPDWVGEC